ncbi:MAG: IS256 family transposase [Planctomycetota bacterium]
MPRRTQTVIAATDDTKIRVSLQDKLLDELLKGCTTPDDITGPDGLLKQLVGRLINRAMAGEMTHHLGYGPTETPASDQPNRRNGTSSKTVRTEHGNIQVDIPRDRHGSFQPLIIPKHERHFKGFDDKIISMYARGMSVRDIRAHLEEIYNVDVSPDLISRATDGVVDELQTWRTRSLEPNYLVVYLVVYLDALIVKIRDKGVVTNKSVCLAIGVGPDGRKETLGMWVQRTEGAKFWLSILSELRQRGIQDILVLCADGLTGMCDAVEAAFPKTIFQTCIVHVIRGSMRFVPWKDRKSVCADLRLIYAASPRGRRGSIGCL